MIEQTVDLVHYRRHERIVVGEALVETYDDHFQVTAKINPDADVYVASLYDLSLYINKETHEPGEVIIYPVPLPAARKPDWNPTGNLSVIIERPK